MNEPMDEYSDSMLSQEGRLRQASILSLALNESRSRRRRRITGKAVAAGVCLLIVFSVFRSTLPTNPPQPQVVQQMPSEIREVPQPVINLTPAPPKKIVVSFIETDPSLLKQLTIPPRKPTWTVIDDDELLRRLGEAGRPAALAYVDGRTIVLFRETKAH